MSRRTHPHARRGGNAIEFALTLPIFVSILFVTIDWGMYFGTRALLDVVVHASCREGALIDPLEDDPAGYTQDRLAEMVDAMPLMDCGTGGANCTFTVTEWGAVPARSLTCEASLTYSPLTNWGPMPDAITTRTLMRSEWQRLPEEL